MGVDEVHLVPEPLGDPRDEVLHVGERGTDGGHGGVLYRWPPRSTAVATASHHRDGHAGRWGCPPPARLAATAAAGRASHRETLVQGGTRAAVLALDRPAHFAFFVVVLVMLVFFLSFLFYSLFLFCVPFSVFDGNKVLFCFKK